MNYNICLEVESLDKPKSLGIIGGLIVFIIIILVIVLLNSDFDNQLINSVEAGVPAEKLIPGIEAEREKEISNAKKDLESHIMDPNYWSKPGAASIEDFNYEKNNNKIDLNSINKLEYLRKKYVHRKISKYEFLNQGKIYKEYLSRNSWSNYKY